jgi:uncharacterized coiled-coil protein SlyX
MNSSSNQKAAKPILIVRADERPAHAYQQIAGADYQQIAHADERPARVSRYTPNLKATEPDDDILIARLGERLAHAYGQIARTDEQLARLTERLSGLERDAARHRSAVPDRRPSPGRPVLRGLVGLLLAACIFAAAFVSQSSHGDAVKQMIARWAPQLILTSSLAPLKKLGPPVLPNSSAAQVVASESMPPQPPPLTRIAPEEVAPTPLQTSPTK